MPTARRARVCRRWSSPPARLPQLTVTAVRALLKDQPRGRVLVSRANPEVIDLLRQELQGASVLAAPSGGTVLVTRADAAPLPVPGGVVGL